MSAKRSRHFIQRSRIEIMVCLLEKSYDGSRKTRLIYGCNLSLSQFNKYADYLIEGKLLTKKKNENNSEIYKITEKGKEFLRDYEKIRKILDEMHM